MAFSSARDFDIRDSEFIDVAGNYNHQITTSIPQVIGGSSERIETCSVVRISSYSASNSRKTNEPNSVGKRVQSPFELGITFLESHPGLSQSSNVAGNQINNVITYITITPGPSSKSICYSTFLPSPYSMLSSRKGHTNAGTFDIYHPI